MSLISLVTLTGCEKDEKVDLIGYPENEIQLSVVATDSPKSILKEISYDEQSKLSGIDSVYKFNIQLATPSAKDATIQLKSILTNVPESSVEIPATIKIPAGKLGTEVVIRLKDFSFFETSKAEELYSIALLPDKIEGEKFKATVDTAKVTFHKEAFLSTVSLQGGQGNVLTVPGKEIENNQFLNGSTVTYAFTARLSKVMTEDVVLTFAPNSYTDNVTCSPAEVTIPAGKLESDTVTCTIDCSFMLQPEELAKGNYTIEVAATPKAENPYLAFDEAKKSITFKLSVQTLSLINAVDPAWTMLARDNWTMELSHGGTTRDMLDGDTNTEVSMPEGTAFTVDMKEEKTLRGIAVRAYHGYYAPQKFKLYVSDDGSDWKELGELPVPLVNQMHSATIVRLLSTPKARYIKFEITQRARYGTSYLTEFEAYE